MKVKISTDIYTRGGRGKISNIPEKSGKKAASELDGGRYIWAKADEELLKTNFIIIHSNVGKVLIIKFKTFNFEL